MQATPEIMFMQRALSDTGFFCRHVLGWNYDQDESTNELKNVGSGGVRSDGPHRQMTDFLDNDTGKRWKHLEAPRGSYKSTILQGYMIRRVLRDPNCRVLYGMHTIKAADKKLQAIKKQFESNETLLKVFGDVRGVPWQGNAFNISGRTLTGLQEYSFQATAPDAPVTGGHFDVIVFDDVVVKENSNTAEKVQKILDMYRFALPLLSAGGTLIIVGTRYFDGDLYGYILGNQKQDFDVLILDSGVDITKKETGEWSLTGTPMFKHQSITYLEQQLRGMDYVEFCSQYLNRIVSGISNPFRREQFLQVRWDDWMSNLTCYVLTDTATSDKEEACHSVVALVGLDSDDVAYLLDLSVGHMSVWEFVESFFAMIEKWEGRVPIRAQLFEKIALNTVFRALIDEEAKRRKVKLNIVDVARGVGEPSKNQRIRALQVRFENNKFRVVDTVPRTFVDNGQIKTLFHPEGHINDKGIPLPDGELVLQLVRFPRYSKNDIADAIADIDRATNDGARICAFAPSAARRFARTVEKSRARGRVFAPREEEGLVDWWDKVGQSPKSASRW